MRHTNNKTVIIWILGALASITPFAIDLYLPAFKDIAEYFHTTQTKISLSVSSYFVGMAIGQILYGPLLDRFGRKTPLYVGLIVFIAASIACTFSQSDTMLVVLRFVQALGGSVAWVAAVTMVRDFFPAHESAKKFSLLILILGVSPLCAPTIGGFLTEALGWKAIFFIVAGIAFTILVIVFIFLPHGQAPDKTVSLQAGPILKTFASILKQPQFATYAFTNAFSFSTLFIYVAGSPVIFMDIYKVSPKVYGGIFAAITGSFIAASQLNIWLTKKYRSEQVAGVALTIQLIGSAIFFAGALLNILDMTSILWLFVICLSSVGMVNPNSTALSLAPFTRNMGSASSLMGFIQLGIAALASGGIGLFDSKDMLPIVSLMFATCVIAFIIHFVGRRVIGKNIVMGTESAEPMAH